MTADVTARLAHALHAKDGEDGHGRDCPACMEDATALLPVVDAIAAERAADELDKLADDWTGWPGSALQVSNLVDTLRELAADLRGGR